MTRPIRAVALAAAILLVPAVSYAAPAFNHIAANDVQAQLVTRGGVIRLGTSVYIHDNTAHAAVGITGITLVNGCDLRVDLDREADEQVVAAIAEEDETMSRLGIQAGISGGVTEANVYLYRDGQRICANDPMFGNRSNVWLKLTYLKGGV